MKGQMMSRKVLAGALTGISESPEQTIRYVSVINRSSVSAALLPAGILPTCDSLDFGFFGTLLSLLSLKEVFDAASLALELLPSRDGVMRSRNGKRMAQAKEGQRAVLVKCLLAFRVVLLIRCPCAVTSEEWSTWSRLLDSSSPYEYRRSIDNGCHLLNIPLSHQRTIAF
jgi:hypothetical protein